MTRVFIALPTSAKIKEEALSIQEEIKKLNKNAPVKWVDKDGMHITIEFLGDLEYHQIEKVKEILKNIVHRYPIFNYRLSFLDVFPYISNPKVLVVKVKDEERVGHSLYSAIHGSLKENGLESSNRPYSPHLTLGRVKARWKPDGFKKIEVPKISWPVDRVILYKSELTPAGSIYTPLEEFKLEKG
jgi:2'-5' RNA ligase